MEISVRKAQTADKNQLDTLLYFGHYSHKHLDWRPVRDWLGAEHYYVAVRADRIVGALAIPPDPPGVCWLRLFSTSVRSHPELVWEQLWQAAREELRQSNPSNIAALSIKPWLTEYLENSGFEVGRYVVVLECNLQDNPLRNHVPAVGIRDMREEDIEQVREVDRAAFEPLWQNSSRQLRLGLEKAMVAQVAELDGRIIGYQISTPSPYGAHLARLAVHPEMQSRGVGRSLIAGLFHGFTQQKTGRITVNTQKSNLVSQNLYLKTGFSFSGDSYPVYEYRF